MKNALIDSESGKKPSSVPDVKWHLKDRTACFRVYSFVSLSVPEHRSGKAGVAVHFLRAF